MRIYFRTKKMGRICSSSSEMQKEYGAEMTRKLQQRLMELRAASTLSEMSPHPPARVHPLKGSRAGQFSVDLIHPFRLVFVPADDPVPLKPDGGVDLAGITAIIVLEICDTHQ